MIYLLNKWNVVTDSRITFLNTSSGFTVAENSLNTGADSFPGLPQLCYKQPNDKFLSHLLLFLKTLHVFRPMVST